MPCLRQQRVSLNRLAATPDGCCCSYGAPRKRNASCRALGGYSARAQLCTAPYLTVGEGVCLHPSLPPPKRHGSWWSLEGNCSCRQVIWQSLYVLQGTCMWSQAVYEHFSTALLAPWKFKAIHNSSRAASHDAVTSARLISLDRVTTPVSVSLSSTGPLEIELTVMTEIGFGQSCPCLSVLHQAACSHNLPCLTRSRLAGFAASSS